MSFLSLFHQGSKLKSYLLLCNQTYLPLKGGGEKAGKGIGWLEGKPNLVSRFREKWVRCLNRPFPEQSHRKILFPVFLDTDLLRVVNFALIPAPPAPGKGDYLSSRPVAPNFSSENLEEKKKQEVLQAPIKKMHMTKSYMNSSSNSFQGSRKVIQAAVVFPVGSQTLHSNSRAPGWRPTGRTHTTESLPGLLFHALWFLLYLM